MKMKILGSAIGFTAYGLIAWQTNWIVCVAIVLAVWGNNLERKG